MAAAVAASGGRYLALSQPTASDAQPAAALALATTTLAQPTAAVALAAAAQTGQVAFRARPLQGILLYFR